MKKSGSAKRIFKEPDRSFFIWIPVFYSEDTHSYHRALPSFLVPYKHYTVNVIAAADAGHQDLDLYDLPSDSSRLRWKKCLSTSGSLLYYSRPADNAIWEDAIIRIRNLQMTLNRDSLSLFLSLPQRRHTCHLMKPETVF